MIEWLLIEYVIATALEQMGCYYVPRSGLVCILWWLAQLVHPHGGHRFGAKVQLANTLLQLLNILLEFLVEFSDFWIYPFGGSGWLLPQMFTLQFLFTLTFLLQFLAPLLLMLLFLSFLFPREFLSPLQFPLAFHFLLLPALLAILLALRTRILFGLLRFGILHDEGLLSVSASGANQHPKS